MPPPKDTGYFYLLEALARTAREAAETACSSKLSLKKQAKIISKLEDTGDAIEHVILDKLNMHLDTPTPLKGRWNIRGLARNIDNIIDQLKKALLRIELSGFVTHEFLDQMRLIRNATRVIDLTLPYFRNIKSRKSDVEIQLAHKRLSQIERDGDILHGKLLAQIEESKKKCRGIKEWHILDRKEQVIDMLENALDQCEDVGSFMDALKLENV